MLTTLFVLLLAAPPQRSIDTLVVCPQPFRQALAPWLSHREDQGHRLAVISNLQSAGELRSQIRRLAATGALRYVVLVGDADTTMHSSASVRASSVPTHYSAAVVNLPYGPETEIATDNWYADLDDDRVPDVAIGRLPCDTPLELATMVGRIVDYENSVDFGAWRRQVHFVAGLGGFGPVADAMLEAAAKSLIREGVPPAYSSTMTYGSWQSPYCPDPRLFQRVTIERLNEGSLFWVYMGHGQQRMLDQVRVPLGSFPILSSADAPQLVCRHAAPIACFLACYSGAFDEPRDCLAEELLRSPGGPVAVLCASRVTMPYAMSVLGSELLRQCFVERAPTVGDALLQAKRRSMQTEGLSPQRRALDAAAGALGPADAPLEAERAEHLDLFNLLGDPLLRIPYPDVLELKAEQAAAAGQSITVSGIAPWPGELTVELAPPRGRLTFQPPPRRQFDIDALGDYADIYRRANEPRWGASQQQHVSGGPFTARVRVGDDARGTCFLRALLVGADGCAIGATEVTVTSPARGRPSAAE